MKRTDEIPHWFLWVWNHGFRVFCGCLLVATIAIVLFGLYTNRRLVDIEQRIMYEPARQYQPPDLSDYAVDQATLGPMLIEQAFYVPIYSHVYYRQGRPYLLEATLSIRNTDPAHTIYVSLVEYFDTHGDSVHKYVDRMIRLKPLQTIDFLVEANESIGGSGANFIVKWSATEAVATPIVEAVMVGVSGTQGVAFSRSGKVISESQPTIEN